AAGRLSSVRLSWTNFGGSTALATSSTARDRPQIPRTTIAIHASNTLRFMASLTCEYIPNYTGRKCLRQLARFLPAVRCASSRWLFIRDLFTTDTKPAHSEFPEPLAFLTQLPRAAHPILPLNAAIAVFPRPIRTRGRCPQHRRHQGISPCR